MSRSSNEPNFRPTATLPVLRLRAEMLDWIRQFFRQRGYWEVETPMLSHDVCVDAWLEPFCVEVRSAGKSTCMYLQTSPEFGMKRLLAAGADAIFQITRAFRQEESGPLHNPEFTIVEWYRVGDTYHQQMDLVEQLVTQFRQHAFEVARQMEGTTSTEVSISERMRSSFNPPFSRMTYQAALRRVLGQDFLAMPAQELMRIAQSNGVEGPSSLRDDDRDGWLNLILSELVEPMLAKQEAVFVYDYPASQAALAKISDQDSAIAERFELYVDGIEICNGYQELTDRRELERRQSEQSRKRQQAGSPALPEDNLLIQALEAGLPECAGVALGFDRLLLSVLGQESLKDVVPFPFDRA